MDPRLERSAIIPAIALGHVHGRRLVFVAASLQGGDRAVDEDGEFRIGRVRCGTWGGDDFGRHVGQSEQVGWMMDGWRGSWEMHWVKGTCRGKLGLHG